MLHLMKKRPLILLCLSSSWAVATACSSSPSTDDGGPPDSTSDVQQQNDSSTKDAAKDSAPNDSSPTDTGSDASDASDASDGAPQVTLTVNDYLSWCKVTVNGGAPNIASPQMYTYPANTVITAVGDTANVAAFYWGYWGNVGPDGGLADGGEDLSKTVTFTITADTTLNACCPDNGSPLSQCTF
jgi:hypothetical protein